MLAILKQRPGEAALVAGTYALVGDHGKPSGFAVTREEGQQLPDVAVADDLGSLSYVLVGEATTDGGAT
jgi:hypothetical protein